MSNNNVLVRYTRNSDRHNGTQRLSFQDDRPDLLIGDVGYVSEDELKNSVRYGVILEPVTADQVHDLGMLTPEERVDDSDKPLDQYTNAELDQIARDEGVDLSGKNTKADRIEAIQQTRNPRRVGAASLPATATIGPVSPGAGIAASPAGSGPTEGAGTITGPGPSTGAVSASSGTTTGGGAAS